jgi:hypothetical protein
MIMVVEVNLVTTLPACSSDLVVLISALRCNKFGLKFSCIQGNFHAPYNINTISRPLAVSLPQEFLITKKVMLQMPPTLPTGKLR